MGRRKNLDKLKEFKEELSEHIKIDKMILFGSRANGTPSRYSDFDLMIVSPSFCGKKSYIRHLGFYKYWSLDYPVDFLCYTPKEFNELSKQITIVQQAAKKGVEIK